MEISKLLEGWRTYAELGINIEGQSNGFNHAIDPDKPRDSYNPDKLNFSQPITHPEAIADAVQRAQSKSWEHTAVTIAIDSTVARWGQEGRRAAIIYCTTESGAPTIAESVELNKNAVSLIIAHIKQSAPAAYAGIRAAKWLRSDEAA